MAGLARGDGLGLGVVLGGSTHLSTWQQNSTINLSAAGNLSITTPAWQQEIIADGFGQFADGHITSDVTLKLQLKTGTVYNSYDVLVRSSATSDLGGLYALSLDIQEAINSALASLPQDAGKSGIDPLTHEPYITVYMNPDGRMMLTSQYDFKLRLTSPTGHVVSGGAEVFKVVP